MNSCFKTRDVIYIFTMLLIGIVIRFLLMGRGHNFDFDSYCIVGDIVARGGNVYSLTARYNYGPMLFLILGALYKISLYFTQNVLVYRTLFVLILTLADIAISIFIYKYIGRNTGKSKKRAANIALLFFLNPISMIITGYHNQFDNIAVALGAYAITILSETSQEETLTKKDVCGIFLLSLSLILKHILWIFPAWLLINRTITAKKKFLYAFIPQTLFLLSFIPYCRNGLEGILNNVFLYRSFNNMPLFALVIFDYFKINFGFIKSVAFPIFVFFMLVGGAIFHNERIENLFLIYTIMLVATSSAIANQYLAIPCMALAAIFGSKSLIYYFLGGIYLSVNSSELYILLRISNKIGILSRPSHFFTNISNWMYTILAWTLVFYLIFYFISYKKLNKIYTDV